MEKYELTLERLFAYEYKIAHKKIQALDAKQKLAWAKEIEDDILPDLYEGTKLYIDKPFPKEDEIVMKPKEFIALMNKIKHWEQIVEWLYEAELGWLFDMITEEDGSVRPKTDDEVLADALRKAGIK